MAICKQCNNTGSIYGGEYLDCAAPGCTAAADFADLDAWLGRNGWGINTRVAREIFKYSRLRHELDLIELDLIELSGNLQELVEQQKQTIDTKQARIDSLIAAKQEAEQRVAELAQKLEGQVTAQPSVTVDTPEFREKLAALFDGGDLGEEAYSAARAPFIAHIDVHTAQAVAQARGAAMAELHPAYEAMQLRALDAEEKLAAQASSPIAATIIAEVIAELIHTDCLLDYFSGESKEPFSSDAEEAAFLADRVAKTSAFLAAAPQQHAQAALSDELPPLPRAAMMVGPDLESLSLRYTKQQMLEYGRAILATRQPAPNDAALWDAMPYAYEFGKSNGDGTYSVVIERGDIEVVAPGKYAYAAPKKFAKEHPPTPLFKRAAQGDAKPCTYPSCTCIGGTTSTCAKAVQGDALIQQAAEDYCKFCSGSGECTVSFDGGFDTAFCTACNGSGCGRYSQGRAAGLEEAARLFDMPSHQQWTDRAQMATAIRALNKGG